MNFGGCAGGPFDGRPLAHPERVYRVAIDKITLKAAPGVLGGANYKFGLYRWNGKVWIWEPPAETS